MNNQNEWEMPPKTKSRAAEFRARARAALKNHWGIAVIAMLLAGLLGAFSLAFGGIADLDELEEWRSSEAVGATVREWIGWGKGFDSTGALIRGIWNRALEWVRASQMHILLTIAAAFAALLNILYALLLGGPVIVGYRRFGLQLIDGGEAKIGNLFGSFRRFYRNTVGARFLIGLIQGLCVLISLAGMGLGVWFYLRYYYGETASAALTYLGIAGGAVLVAAGWFCSLLVSFRFVLYPFLLADYPQFTPVQALRHSKALMKGNKARLFRLYCSFIGWLLLGIVTLGIGMLWALPYLHTAEAEFYDEISDRSRAGNLEFPSLDPNDYA